MSGTSMTYEGTGVNYPAMDPFKRACQISAQWTSSYLGRHDLEEVKWTRGESVYLIFDRKRNCFWGHVHEGLGTKNLVADALSPITGQRYYQYAAMDTLAMGINDAATLGVRPTTVTMHLAVGTSSWFDDMERSQALIDGWVNTCKYARCTWAGGETPTLKDVILPEAAELSCSVYGIIDPPEKLIKGDIEHGDHIVLLGSSGIHANGLTMARRIADELPKGYATLMSDGEMYGEALVTPTHIYSRVVEDCLDAGVNIHYTANITGHGWRKLMRSTKPFHYVITTLPEPQPVFRFIQEHGRVSNEEMYGNFNMGAGFALYVPPGDVDRVTAIANEHHMTALDAGFIDAGLRPRQNAEEKKVIIEPLGIEWTGEALGVR